MKNECKFSQGFACALATVFRYCKQDVYIMEALETNFMTITDMRAKGVDQYDIETLKPIVKQIQKKQRIRKS